MKTKQMQTMPIALLRETVFAAWAKHFAQVSHEGDNWNIREDGSKPAVRHANDFGLWLWNNPEAQTRAKLIDLWHAMQDSLRLAYGIRI